MLDMSGVPEYMGVTTKKLAMLPPLCSTTLLKQLLQLLNTVHQF